MWGWSTTFFTSRVNIWILLGINRLYCVSSFKSTCPPSSSSSLLRRLSHVYYMWDWTTLLPPAGAPGYCCGSVRTTQFKYLWNLSPFVVETYKYKSILFLTFSIILFILCYCYCFFCNILSFVCCGKHIFQRGSYRESDSDTTGSLWRQKMKATVIEMWC